MHLSLVLSVIISFSAILVLRPLAVNWGLVDTPDNRKQHSGNIPLIGGLAIYLSTLSTVSLHLDNKHINLILISISLMVFIGALDDRYDLNAKLRLIAQILIASILTFGTDIQISSFGDLFGFGEIYTGPLSGLVTVLAIVAGINAFNMTDGIDGLAGTLALISLLAISFVISDVSIELLIGALTASLIVFLLFNLGLFSKKNKIFMGDAGSMMLGLVVSWLLIVTSQSEQAIVAPAHVLWFIAIPLIDMIAVMFRRLRKGKSPLVADREHLHHVFMDIGLNSRQALLFISSISLVFGLIGFLIISYQLPEYITVISFIVTFIIYNKLLSLRHKFKLPK
ncbi:undecaprenyl-phosphate alpha-N-acetylglucosaminyl 1-phosphate transferase [Kangiella koreensis]|uniref:Undecaprenyl-phosphate alpha-N-acetylglucosaminyl 1-phosphate transferase n=1 Tax=Kangiella koreensis (strain DSM 16069 / JCM 12317 / KCTC 12182 / SW-125) TaxID=523791 RepID=C7RAP6_KANKD|nr:undecaprenyl-phosphate alpha-N-acetylglucosaminyl 1-phosphate transferase [Kangiella koreensis]ACV26338.1 glycosyl transferase family 4 [Kangiella koreensis DSM 16069]